MTDNAMQKQIDIAGIRCWLNEIEGDALERKFGGHKGRLARCNAIGKIKDAVKRLVLLAQMEASRVYSYVEVLAMFDKGMNCEEISRETGYHPEHVAMILADPDETGHVSNDDIQKYLTANVKKKKLSWEDMGAEELKTLAENGDSDAQYELGTRFSIGYGGVHKNARTAKSWLAMAAKAGNTDAQCYIDLYHTS